MKLTDLDIPLGLEILWNKIFRPAVNGFTDIIFTKKTPASVRQYDSLNDLSLFVRWQGLFNGFTALRKDAWQEYWETLPFGSHSGSRGWPGSGYSAFIYVNAPRFKLSLDLLLDPPISNLVLNGTFDTDLTHWDFDESFPDYVAVIDGQMNFLANDFDDGDPVYILQMIDALEVGDYTVAFDASIPAGFDGYPTSIRVSMGFPEALYVDDVAQEYAEVFDNGAVLTHYSFKFTIEVIDEFESVDRTLRFTARGMPADIGGEVGEGTPHILDNIIVTPL